eukprot:7770906-Alexandrium_andersonii.AAC.1
MGHDVDAYQTLATPTPQPNNDTSTQHPNASACPATPRQRVELAAWAEWDEWAESDKWAEWAEWAEWA